MQTPQYAVNRPISSTGIGLRHCHLEEIIETRPDVAWFEILADNHLQAGGKGPMLLERIRQDYPFTFHSVNMSLGGTDPLDIPYLKKLKQLMHDFQPNWISDHLCFTHVDNNHYHELLPLPYTEEALNHLCTRIQQAQDILGERILIENVSSYITYSHSKITEWEFLNELATRTDCELLLDVNNVYVSAINHRFDALSYLSGISYERVKEIHLAGFEIAEDYLLDAHNNRVSDQVWKLFESVMKIANHIPALIEWDNDIPAFGSLEEEAHKAEVIRDKTKKLNLRETG